MFQGEIRMPLRIFYLSGDHYQFLFEIAFFTIFLEVLLLVHKQTKYRKIQERSNESIDGLSSSVFL